MISTPPPKKRAWEVNLLLDSVTRAPCHLSQNAIPSSSEVCRYDPFGLLKWASNICRILQERGISPGKRYVSFHRQHLPSAKKMVIKRRIDTVHACIHTARSRLPRKYDMIKSSDRTNNKRETNTNPFEINPTQTRYHLHSKLHPLHLLLQIIYMHH